VTAAAYAGETICLNPEIWGLAVDWTGFGVDAAGTVTGGLPMPGVKVVPTVPGKVVPGRVVFVGIVHPTWNSPVVPGVRFLSVTTKSSDPDVEATSALPLKVGAPVVGTDEPSGAVPTGRGMVNVGATQSSAVTFEQEYVMRYSAAAPEVTESVTALIAVTIFGCAAAAGVSPRSATAPTVNAAMAAVAEGRTRPDRDLVDME